MNKVLERAARLINVADPDGGNIVQDYGVGIAEPGYGDAKTVWALGNWNPKRFARQGEPPLTNEESLAPRLGEALERVGVEIHWLDEWERCTECQCIVRTTDDSYSWLPYYVQHPADGEILCLNCIPQEADEFNDLLAEYEYIDNPERAVMERISQSQLIDAGWEQHNGQYASGWHPGQNDNPRTVFDAIKSENPDLQVLFRISGKGQFDLHFESWTRPEEDDESPLFSEYLDKPTVEDIIVNM